MVEDKYIGLALAVASTIGIGASFVITKMGLNAAAERHGFEGEGFTYLRNPVWWAGMVTMIVGEVCNFAAYAFAPAILVTPLGALSVLIGAVLGSYFLGERLGILGRIGCATCFIGSVVIVLHAPPDRELNNIDELLHLAMQWGFMIYCTLVSVFSVIMIYRISPIYGKKNPLIYLSICSSVGSISIMAIKGFGIAIKLTLGGNNQFSHPSTYVFAVVVVVCILTQMNYFNKALSQFSTNIVNPLYYVTFTTCTLIASFTLFGANTTDAVNTLSLLCGFLTIFTGVYLLNLSREDPDGNNLGIKSRDADSADARGIYHEVDGIPTDGIASLNTRFSMQSRRSGEEHRRSTSWSLRSPIVDYGQRPDGGKDGGSGAHNRRDGSNLMHSYDVEANHLGKLVDESDDDDDDEDDSAGSNRKRTSFDKATGRRVGTSASSAAKNGGEGSSSTFGAPRRSRTVESETVRMGGKSFDKARR